MNARQQPQYFKRPAPRVPKLPPLKQDLRPRVRMFTDGSYDSKTGDCGWGVVIKHGAGTTEKHGGYAPGGDENFGQLSIYRAELRAIYIGLRKLSVPTRVELFTDCQEIVAWLYGWHPMRMEPNRNFLVRPALPIRASVEPIQRYLVYARHTLERVEWVKAHSGQPENETADEIAVRCRVHKIREMKADET